MSTETFVRNSYVPLSNSWTKLDVDEIGSVATGVSAPLKNSFQFVSDLWCPIREIDQSKALSNLSSFLLTTNCFVHNYQQNVSQRSGESRCGTISKITTLRILS